MEQFPAPYQSITPAPAPPIALDPAIASYFGLMDYQIMVANFVLNAPKCGLFLKMGLGKTRIALAVIAQLNLPYHILVIAPKPIARSSWIDEINKIGIPIRTKSLMVNKNGKKLTRKKRIALYETVRTDPPTMYFINRDLAKDIADYFGKSWPFGFLIVDELQSFKGYSSDRFKALKKIFPYYQRFLGLTGTPRPKGLEDLWPEIYLMDGGARLGPNITSFRETFCRPGYGLSPQGYPYEWIPLPGAEEEVYRRISDIVISMDYIDPPSLVYNNFTAHMEPEEEAVYKKMAKDFIFQYGMTEDEAVEACSSGVLQNKLLQIASGFLYTDKQHNYITIHSAKLDILQYIYDNEPDNLLVAYSYQVSRDMILDRFKDAVLFDGSKEMQDAWNAKKYRMMLIQPKSHGLGINIQFGGHTLVWYDMTWSLEDYQQTVARLARTGQSDTVVVHHILTDKTVDWHVLDVVQQKNQAQEQLMDAVRFMLDD